MRFYPEDTCSRFLYETICITIQKTVTFIMTYISWQCSSVGSLTPECEETNLSVFLLTGSCDYTTTESVQALSYIIQTSTNQITHLILCNFWVKITVQEWMAWTYQWFRNVQHTVTWAIWNTVCSVCVPICVKNSATS